MKNILYISGLLLLAVTGISCSDDFLSKNDVTLYTLYDTLYLNNYQEDVETSITLPTLVNTDYTIFMQPKWLEFGSMHGEVNNGNVPLSFSIEKENAPSGFQIHYGTIMIDIDYFGVISFIVAYFNFGYPTLQCSASSLNFESSNSQTFTISNISEGILFWKITGIPDWLIISPDSGLLYNGNSATISASLNYDNITTGQELSGTMQITSNSTTGNLTVPLYVSAKAIIPAEVRQINGIVTDAEYNHESGIMAICTKSPDKLIVFNTNANEADTISLTSTPNCVSLSEDGHKAVIGYSEPSVSYVDIDNLEITEDYTIDCVPYDIVLGDNGWCYITPTVGQWVFFRNLNLNTGQLIIGKNGNTIYERTIIRKISGKPYLVGSRLGLSPTGILIFDVTGGPANDTISYYHESIFYFWISKDGAKLYTGSRNIYNLPEYDKEYHSFPPPVYGQIGSELQNISAFDECPAINSFFTSSSYYYFQRGYSSLIEQFSITTLSKTGTFNVSPVYVTENGSRTLYETSARFIFVNKEGSTLYAIKNLQDGYYKDYWTM